MWGTSSNYESITSYDGAKRTFENTKPVRGTDIRPLDTTKRSSTPKSQIIKDGDRYIVRLYRTNIVTYYPNGDVLLNNGGYDSQSTAAAISCMSPFSCWLNLSRLVVCNRYGPGGKFLLEPRLLFKRDAEGVYQPENPPAAKVYRTRVIKEKAKKTRTYFAQVPVYIKAFSAAFDRGVKPEIEFISMEQTFNSGEPLEDQQASNLAWAYVSEDWHVGGLKILNEPKPAIARFWKDVYARLNCIESYSIDLPLGEV